MNKKNDLHETTIIPSSLGPTEEISVDVRQNFTKYKKLLNNLLEIKGREMCLFTVVDNISAFDIYTKFGANAVSKLTNQLDTLLDLEEKDIETLRDEIDSLNDPNKIINLFHQYKEKLFIASIEQLRNPKSFERVKKQLISELEEKIQNRLVRWKQFDRHVKNQNSNEGVWPLHIATFFINVATKSRPVYAPLILKEVAFDFSSHTIALKTVGNWKLNEKLAFILDNEAITRKYDIDFTGLNGKEAIEKIEKTFGYKFNWEQEAFKNLRQEKVTSLVVEAVPGMVLGLFKPAGGYLRDTMIEIIKNDEVHKIINPHIFKDQIENKVNRFIENESNKILVVQTTNYSQKKAIAAALNDDVIIWGPPGTGKSQVIANIIANLIYRQKKAIVISQKRAALDVLKNRLGKLTPFVLFVLSGNDMEASEFYKPLQLFIDLIEKESVDEPKLRNLPLISKEEIETLKAINRAKVKKTYYPTIEFLKYFADFKQREEIVRDMAKLDTHYTYPLDKLEEKAYLKAFARDNSISKKGWWIFKKYDNSTKSLSKNARLFIETWEGFNINDYFAQAKGIDMKIAARLIKAPRTLLREPDTDLDTSLILKQGIWAIKTKIAKWNETNDPLSDAYKKLATAIRGAKRLPINFLNEHRDVIKEVFPIIITTPETSFINWEKNYFDYAILDESSQIFVEIGLPLLYLCKRKVLAGDPEQMQPSRWFASRDDSDLDEAGVEYIPENSESLLDYAIDKGVYQVMLNQNYRADYAALMSFSAKEFYQSKLEVIDQSDVEKNENKPIEVYNIHGTWDNSMNKAEALKVLEIATKNIDKYPKIIILTFNSTQLEYIEKTIIQKHPILWNALEKETLLLRNIENIQGDEADLVIASVVYDENTNMASTYVTRPGGGKALNVAISRAKTKMIVVKSITSENIGSGKSQDYAIFRKWLEFLDMKDDEQRKYSLVKENSTFILEDGAKEEDSSFENDVIEVLKKQNFIAKHKLVRSYEIGSKSIDIAFINNVGKFVLGLEIDNYSYHNGKGFDEYLNNMSQQEFLELKGYPIYRIREIDWHLNQSKILSELKERFTA